MSVWFRRYRFKQEKHTSTIGVVVGKTGKAKSAGAERVASVACAKTRQQNHVVMRVCSRVGEASRSVCFAGTAPACTPFLSSSCRKFLMALLRTLLNWLFRLIYPGFFQRCSVLLCAIATWAGRIIYLLIRRTRAKTTLFMRHSNERLGVESTPSFQRHYAGHIHSLNAAHPTLRGYAHARIFS